MSPPRRIRQAKVRRGPITILVLHCEIVCARRPIVHRAGGMLLQMQKELGICADLKPEDMYFYYTTTSVFSQAAKIDGCARLTVSVAGG